MIKPAFAMLLVVAACGGGTPKPDPGPPANTTTVESDECQRFVDKSRPVLDQIAGQAKKEITDADYDKLVADCRTQGVGEDRALMDCVLAAADAAAVSECWSAAMSDYAASAKRP